MVPRQPQQDLQARLSAMPMAPFHGDPSDYLDDDDDAATVLNYQRSPARLPHPSQIDDDDDDDATVIKKPEL